MVARYQQRHFSQFRIGHAEILVRQGHINYTSETLTAKYTLRLFDNMGILKAYAILITVHKAVDILANGIQILDKGSPLL